MNAPLRVPTSTRTRLISPSMNCTGRAVAQLLHSVLRVTNRLFVLRKTTNRNFSQHDENAHFIAGARLGQWELTGAAGTSFFSPRVLRLRLDLGLQRDPNFHAAHSGLRIEL